MLGYCCLTSHHNTIDDHGYKLAPKIARMGEAGYNQNGSPAPECTMTRLPSSTSLPMPFRRFSGVETKVLPQSTHRIEDLCIVVAA
jgi:hypothetical protein